MFRRWLLVGFLFVGSLLLAEEAPTKEELKKNLTGRSGVIELPGGLAKLNLDAGYQYLDPEQTKFLLEKVWQNPDGSGFLGAILPADFGTSDGGAWAALLSYDASGHVKDDDATNLNYDDLLRDLKDSATESNKMRREKGFEEVQILGWATKPHYDASGKTLYWAKELSFGGSKNHTLNYEMRVLGREGVLDLNVVAGLEDLAKVEQATPTLLKQSSFVPGQTYADYQDGSDHLAEYGVAGLILGGVALKAGLFKVILTFLAASWKFILIGLAAVGAWASRFLKRKPKPVAVAVEESAAPEGEPEPETTSPPESKP